MSAAKVVGQEQLAALREAARLAARRRANLNLHPELADPVQRFFNCFEPGSYVRPHRHDPHRWELFVLLQGKAGVLLFSPEGAIFQRVLLAPTASLAVEIPGGVFHTLVALAPSTVLFEVKPGPYQALADKDFAPWAPSEAEDQAARKLLAAWQREFPGG